MYKPFKSEYEGGNGSCPSLNPRISALRSSSSDSAFSSRCATTALLLPPPADDGDGAVNTARWTARCGSNGSGGNGWLRSKSSVRAFLRRHIRKAVPRKPSASTTHPMVTETTSGVWSLLSSGRGVRWVDRLVRTRQRTCFEDWRLGRNLKMWGC
jgi:hypothetical protein